MLRVPRLQIASLSSNFCAASSSGWLYYGSLVYIHRPFQDWWSVDTGKLRQLIRFDVIRRVSARRCSMLAALWYSKETIESEANFKKELVRGPALIASVLTDLCEYNFPLYSLLHLICPISYRVLSHSQPSPLMPLRKFALGAVTIRTRSRQHRPRALASLPC